MNPALSMFIPRMMLSALLLLAGSHVLSAAAPPRRFGSGPLTRSVQNETDAAIARAQTWLLEQQAADGSWGASNLYLTAVCALAVGGDGARGPADQASAVARARRWLAQPPATPAPATPAGLRATAWRELALHYLGEAPPAPPATLPGTLSASASNLLVELVMIEVCALRKAPLPGLDFVETGHPVEDLLRAAQSPLPEGMLRRHLAALAAAWFSPDLRFWSESQAQHAWWLARTLNRRTGGVLPLANGSTLDWRRDLAGYWVNHQRITPRGGGHWVSDVVSSLEETAFAILLLREL
jgi:hypothetical protein